MIDTESRGQGAGKNGNGGRYQRAEEEPGKVLVNTQTNTLA